MEMVGTMKLVLEAELSMGPTIAMAGNGSAQRFVSVDAPAGATVELNVPHPLRSAVRVTNVRFTEPLAKGAEVELLFETASVGRASQFLIDERIAIASWTDAWHPFPIPDPTAGESLSGKMRSVGTTTFHLPPGWRGVCNGVRVEREESEDGTREVWELEQPLAHSFAAGPFHQYTEQAGERTVTVSRLSESKSQPDMHALAAAAALEAMEAKLGPYPYDDFYIVDSVLSP